ncbi:MAG: MBL fold metallo-hydrolase [Parcubacteria group bacterium]|nr:MBL fold metallo-hydrolase [Parcubacteria group bacterium]
MIISWYGEACFLLESSGVRILIEPPQKESGLNSPRLKSDVLIYSKPREERQEDSGTFIINGPGEYEIKNINISGIGDNNPSTSPSAMSSGPNGSGQANTIYTIEMDDIKMIHFGLLKTEPNNEKLELIGEPDIVFVPIGGLKSELFDAETAMKLINKIEPKIAVPMLYDIKGLKTKRAPLSLFLKESEAKDSPLPKLSVKKKDLIEEETKIVILEKI